MSPIILLIVVVVAAVAAGAGYFIGYNNRKKTAEAQIGSAEAEATRLVNEAIKTADQKRKEAVLEAKDEAFRLGVSRGIDPFMTLSFMALPVIPSLRLTTRGVFDVLTQRYV